jgi:hypothetical protein
MYTDNIDSAGQIIPNTVKRISDGKIIEFDVTNEDYQQYLSWQAEQNPMEPWAPEIPEIRPMIFPDSGS